MLIPYIALASAIMSKNSPPDCGAKNFSAIIKKTNSLVLAKEPVGSLVGEFPTPRGTPECVRVKFSIDGDGHAVDISIPESSGSFEVDMAAVKSLRKYHFKTEIFSWFRTYMIVFNIDYNKIPENYFHHMKSSVPEE